MFKQRDDTVTSLGNLECIDVWRRETVLRLQQTTNQISGQTGIHLDLFYLRRRLL